MLLDLATNLALIFLIAESVVIVAVVGAILYFCWRGAMATAQWLHKIGMPNAKKYSRLAADETSRYSIKITEPLIKVDTQITQFTGVIGAIPRLLRRRQRS